MEKLFTLLIVTFLTTANASWKLVHNEDGIKIFAGESLKSGVIPFKAHGLIDASVEDISSVLNDYHNKHHWSPKLKEVKMHKVVNSNTFLFSEYYSTPWPAVDREFLLLGMVKKYDNGVIKYSAKSVDNNLKRNDHIQTDVKELTLVLTPKNNYQTQVTFIFNGDMKGWMPVWLMNLIQKKWPLRFIQGLRKQL